MAGGRELKAFALGSRPLVGGSLLYEEALGKVGLG